MSPLQCEAKQTLYCTSCILNTAALVLQAGIELLFDVILLSSLVSPCVGWCTSSTHLVVFRQAESGSVCVYTCPQCGVLVYTCPLRQREAVVVLAWPLLSCATPANCATHTTPHRAVSHTNLSPYRRRATQCFVRCTVSIVCSERGGF